MHKHLFGGLAILVCVIVLVGCHPKPSVTEKPVLVGLADFHTHQFGYLGFGGKALSHSVNPADPCIPPPPHDKSTFHMKDLVRDGLFAEATEQAKHGQCYPTLTNMASQRMDTANLRRAWEYGLRLMVMFAVNSEFLCAEAELGIMDDKSAIEIQIQAAKDLQAQIDNDSGGPGLGWYRIVYTPEEARAAIGQGKLAVVLGIEASNAFGGVLSTQYYVPGVPPLIGSALQEHVWYVYFNDPFLEPGFESMQTQKALALFEYYWGLGVRHFFPIHNMDGTAGGAALSIPILHADNNPSRVAQGGLLNKVPDIDRVIRAVRPQIQSADCSSRFGSNSFEGGRCNASGLTETGRALIRLMASYGAVIDIDHMSWKTKRELLSDTGLLGGVYPFVSSHSGIQEINHGDKNNEGQLAIEDFAAMVRAGGAFAPILPPVTSTLEEDTYPTGATIAPHQCGGTSESFVQAYRYVVEKLRNGKLFNGNSAFVGVGFGTDFGAPVPIAAAPRFNDTTIPVQGVVDFSNIVAGFPLTGRGGGCYNTAPSSIAYSGKPHVNYPFTSPIAPQASFDRSTTPWGGRTQPYDISFDGVVHEGMIPDFVEELRALGLTENDLQPFWHGAEAYVRAWESSMGWQGATFNAEYNKGITEDCRKLRSNLISTSIYNTRLAQKSDLEQLKQKGCEGF